MHAPSDDAREVQKLRTQRAALARFGGRALREHDLDALLQEACELVSDACGVEFAKVLELMPDGENMLIRAGVNWSEGVVGRATLPAHTGSPAGYALETKHPVVSSDVAAEGRFTIPDVLRDHGVRSMVNVLIECERGPWGVLEVDSRIQRDFDADDIAFLQTYANLLAAAIDRHEIHHQLADALERVHMLQAELQHRSRNLLANIGALVRRTLASSADLDGFRTAFLARLAALGRTQDLLVSGTTSPISLRTILLSELEAHGAEPGDRVSLSGPDLTLSPPIAQALAMGFHELATNATKHGALGREEGRLEVTWSCENGQDGSEIVVRWRETGVQILSPPSRRGTGMETLERSLPRMLDGAVEMRFLATGAECVIRFMDTR